VKMRDAMLAIKYADHNSEESRNLRH
jgi:hypothetical protein